MLCVQGDAVLRYGLSHRAVVHASCELPAALKKKDEGREKAPDCRKFEIGAARNDGNVSPYTHLHSVHVHRDFGSRQRQ
jgi:hypothetical protein